MVCATQDNTIIFVLCRNLWPKSVASSFCQRTQSVANDFSYLTRNSEEVPMRLKSRLVHRSPLSLRARPDANETRSWADADAIGARLT